MTDIELLDELASAFHIAANRFGPQGRAAAMGQDNSGVGIIFFNERERNEDLKADILHVAGTIYRDMATKLRSLTSHKSPGNPPSPSTPQPDQ